MKLTIIYDNEVYDKKLKVSSDWGFSCIIEIYDKKILFDAGAKGEILIENMRELDVEIENIDIIVISHEHWDHNGGLIELSKYLSSEVKIYRLSRDKFTDKFQTVIVDKPIKIIDGVYSTGRLPGIAEEQSLILKGVEGWYIIVGCSHPGVDNIFNTSQKIVGEITGIIGGMHDFHDLPLLNKLELISPCHCTKYKREISRMYPKKTETCGVGKIFEL